MQNDQKSIERKKKGYGTALEISQAGEIIAGNVDLLTEILLRVPAKSLIRFRCVSKHWLSLISHSQFGSNHSIRNPKPSISGLFFDSYRGRNSISLHGHQNLPSLSSVDGLKCKECTTMIHLTHTCNGLLLFDHSLCRHQGDELQYIVCNTTTQKYKILSISSSYFSKLDHRGYLAFDSSKSPHYKVVLVGHYSTPYAVVYSSQSACWKQVSVQPSYDLGRGVFWNGGIHWFTIENVLVRYDVDAEEKILMSTPQTPKIFPRGNIMYFGECAGVLILIQSRLRFPRGFRILELDKDYCCWIVKCRVNLRPLFSDFPEMESKIFRRTNLVLCVMKGDEKKGFTLLLAIPGRIISYSPRCKTWDVLLRDLASGESIGCGVYNAYPFVETLVPV